MILYGNDAQDSLSSDTRAILFYIQNNILLIDNLNNYTKVIKIIFVWRYEKLLE